MKFSVVIPTYRRVKFLEKAIESVTEQTHRNFEIIVVNDYPDDKPEIDRIVKKFEKVTVHHLPVPKGGNAARNAGIMLTSGDLIAFLDDDDIWLPTKLEEHHRVHVQNAEAGLVYSNCLYVHNNPFMQDQATNSALPKNVIKAMSEARFCPTTSSIVTIKRDVIESCGIFDEKMLSFQDWDYWFRIAHKYTFEHIPSVLVIFRQHLGDRVSQNESKRQQGINQICEKWGEEIDTRQFAKRMNKILYYQLAINALMGGDKPAFVKKSLQLLTPKNLSPQSFSSFVNLWLHTFIKNRKRRLRLKSFLAI